MYLIEKRPGEDLFIGFEGENKARKVIFDVSDWKARFGGEGRVELIYQRPSESDPYPIAVEREGGTAAWTITNTDTAKAGAGCAELRYYMGETLVKSTISVVTVARAMEEPGEVPAAMGQSWLDQVLEAARRAEAAAPVAVVRIVRIVRIVTRM